MNAHELAENIVDRIDKDVELYYHGSETTAARQVCIEFIEALLTEFREEAEEQGRYGGKKDLETLEHNTAIVYCSITGNKISKPFTKPYSVISEFEDEVTKACDEAVAQEREECAKVALDFTACNHGEECPKSECDCPVDIAAQIKARGENKC